MIDLTPEDSILFAGDWHGSASEARWAIERAVKEGATTIVQVGDFGIWNDDDRFLNKTQVLLENKNIMLYFVDGNHENFDRLYSIPLEEDGTRKIRDNIYHLPRGFRWEWAGVSFLAVGGAASIDKNHRKKGKSWWPQELITEEDITKAIEGGKVDVLVSHDSPSTAPNSIVDDVFGQLQAKLYWGEDIMHMCAKNRHMLSRITNIVKPYFIFHGHYHQYMSYAFNHSDGTEAYVFGLDEGSAPRDYSTTTYPLSSLRAQFDHMRSRKTGPQVEGMV